MVLIAQVAVGQENALSALIVLKHNDVQAAVGI